MEIIIKACRFPAKHILLILDCCYDMLYTSDQIGVRIQGATEDYIRDMYIRVALQVLRLPDGRLQPLVTDIRPGYSAFTRSSP